MKLLPLLLLALAGTLAGCKAPDPAPAASAPCICGTPEGAFDGCGHPLCVVGERNPDNPECVCGPLEFGAEGGSR